VPVLDIESIEVRRHDLEVVVRVLDLAYLRTSATPGLVDRAAGLLPGLARHSCENDDGRDFLREIRDTETPHLLEHVTCELMALAGSPRSLRGDTSWDFARDGRGVFRVRIEFDDDLVALGALQEGAEIVDWLLRGDGEHPDLDEVVARLRGLRTREPRQ